MHDALLAADMPKNRMDAEVAGKKVMLSMKTIHRSGPDTAAEWNLAGEFFRKNQRAHRTKGANARPTPSNGIEA
ncbi:MAG: hypothetical protein FJ398_02290 [Verrucomicrobia bacterium]|nr:hypothetical protein [Verrucomicrobiota bacterium]